MGYTLLWVETLAVALFAVAAATAFLARATRPWMGRIVLGIALAAPLLAAAPATAFAGLLHSIGMEHHWLWYMSSWLACLVIGYGLILWRGLRRTDGARGAANWPAVRLVLACAAAVALDLMTFWNMDTTAKMRLSSVRLEAGAIAVALAPPRPPDQENAAFVYEKAFAAYKLGSAKWRKGFDKADYNTADPELRSFLTAHQPTIALLKRAAAMTGCYFERSYAQPSMDMALPELAKLREGARILAADARCKAADGQVRAALENVTAMQAMSRHVSAEPLVISGLVSIAIDAIALETLEGILAVTTPSAADLAVLRVEDTVSFQRTLRRSLMGEEAFGMARFSMFSGDSQSQSLNDLGVSEATPAALVALWRVYLLPDDMTNYKKQMTRMRERVASGFTGIAAAADGLDEGKEGRRAGILCGMMLPVLSNICRNFARAEARHRLGQLAVAVAAYRAKTGQWPAKLDSLVPDYIADVPLDPFDDQPLRMKASANGITLYSICEDLVDDEGKPFDDVTRKGDVGFRIGNAAKAAQ